VSLYDVGGKVLMLTHVPLAAPAAVLLCRVALTKALAERYTSSAA
jgi:hypothetical protein